MARKENGRLYIDGSDFEDLNVTDMPEAPVKGVWDFLKHVVPSNPWIAGLATIIAIVWLGANASMPVQITALLSAVVITVSSTWKRSSDGRTKKANEPGDVGTHAVKDRSVEGTPGQRLTLGSDPPIGGAARDTERPAE